MLAYLQRSPHLCKKSVTKTMCIEHQNETVIAKRTQNFVSITSEPLHIRLTWLSHKRRLTMSKSQQEDCIKYGHFLRMATTAIFHHWTKTVNTFEYNHGINLTNMTKFGACFQLNGYGTYTKMETTQHVRPGQTTADWLMIRIKVCQYDLFDSITQWPIYTGATRNAISMIICEN